MAKNNNETTVTFKVFNKQFKDGLKENTEEMKKLRQEGKLNQEQLKLTGSESEKFASTLENLQKQHELSKQKTEATKKALAEAKTLYGENSTAVSEMEKNLRSAQISEQNLANRVEQTTQKLAEAKNAESDRAKSLVELKDKQLDLESSAEKLTKQYELQKAELGENASESQKAKLHQENLANQMNNSAEQVANLERQLELSKQQFGASSQEVDKLEKELLDAKIATKEFSNELEKSTNIFNNFSEKAKKVGDGLVDTGKKLTMGVTAPIVAGAGLSVKAASDFESAFAGVKKTVDEQVDSNGKVLISYKDLETGIRDMAKEMPPSASSISEVAESAGQLGIKTENVLSFTKTMIDMGESTDLASNDAASALAKFANITKMSQGNFDRLGSSIVDLGNNFATTESNIVDMALRLAGAGSQVGMSEADIVGLAAALSSVGIEAEMGGSAISKVMVSMAVASKTGLDQVRELENATGMTRRELELMQNLDGKGFKQLASSMNMTTTELGNIIKAGKDLEGFASIANMTGEQFKKAFEEDAIGAIGAFIEGLGTAEDKGQSAIELLDEMGIKEVRLRDALLRAGNASELFSEAVGLSNDAWKENGALTEEAEKRYETFESKVQVVKNKINDLAIEVGGPLMGALSDMIDGLQPLFDLLTKIAEGFTSLDPNMQKVIMTFLAVAAVVGPILIVIGKLALAISSIAGLFGTGGALASVGIWITGTLLPALGTVVGAIVGWPLIIGAAIAALVVIIYKNWDKIVKYLTKFGKWCQELFTGIGKGVKDSWNEMIDSISKTLEQWGNAISSKFEAWKNMFKEKFNAIKETGLEVWNNMYDSASTKISNFVDGVKAVLDVLVNIIMIPVSLIQTLLEAAWLYIQAGAYLAWLQIEKYIVDPITSASQKVMEIIAVIGEWFNEKFTELGEYVSEKWNLVKENIINPFNEAATAVFNKSSEIVAGVIGWFDDLRIKTIEKWAEIRDAVSLKITEAKDLAVTKAQEIWTGISDKFQSAVNTTKDKFDKVKNAIVDPLNDAKDKVKGVLDDIVDFFKKIKFPSFTLDKKTVKIGTKDFEIPAGIGVKWNAKGGIFDNPTIAGMFNGRLQGIGEAGPEAMIPLSESVLSKIGQSILSSLSTAEILVPLLTGIEEAAKTKMDNNNQQKTDPAMQQFMEMMSQFMEMMAQRPVVGEQQFVTNIGSLNTQSVAEYDEFNRKMQLSYKLAESGLRGE